jgi:undecaprenyl pyrophosphate synthase
MDGNRRWAAARGLPSIAGHVQGVEAIKPIVRCAPDRRIEVLSLLVDALRSLIAAGTMAGAVDERRIAEHLHTAGQPDVDLLIRTGGEQRTSNFLLWQGAYAELVFSAALWPDVGEADLDAALDEFARRHRRFGS